MLNILLRLALPYSLFLANNARVAFKQALKHGRRRFPGEPAARGKRKTIICAYVGPVSKVAQTCLTKLFYKKLGYPSIQDENAYLESLAEGGFMAEAVGKLDHSSRVNSYS